MELQIFSQHCLLIWCDFHQFQCSYTVKTAVSWACRIRRSIMVSAL